MGQNLHWQRLIEAQRMGIRINVQQRNGDPLVSVKVVLLNKGILLENEHGATVTIELNDICGIEFLEIAEDEPDPVVLGTNLGKLFYYQKRIQFIKLYHRLPRGADNYLIKKIVSIDEDNERLIFVDDFGKIHRVAIKNIKEIHVTVSM